MKFYFIFNKCFLNIRKKQLSFLLISLLLYSILVSFAFAIETDLTSDEMLRLKKTVIRTIKSNDFKPNRFMNHLMEPLLNEKFYNVIHFNHKFDRANMEKIFLVEFIPNVHIACYVKEAFYLYFKVYKKCDGEFSVINGQNDMNRNMGPFNDFINDKKHKFMIYNHNIIDYCLFVSFMTIHPDAGDRLLIMKSNDDIEKAIEHMYINYHNNNFKPLLQIRTDSKKLTHIPSMVYGFKNDNEQQLFFKQFREKVKKEIEPFHHDISYHYLVKFPGFYIVKFYIYSESKQSFYEYKFYLFFNGEIGDLKIREIDTFMYPLTETEVLKLREDIKKSK